MLLLFLGIALFLHIPEIGLLFAVVGLEKPSTATQVPDYGVYDFEIQMGHQLVLLAQSLDVFCIVLVLPVNLVMAVVLVIVGESLVPGIEEFTLAKVHVAFYAFLNCLVVQLSDNTLLLAGCWRRKRLLTDLDDLVHEFLPYLQGLLSGKSVDLLQ